jgi:hypothetical protein
MSGAHKIRPLPNGRGSDGVSRYLDQSRNRQGGVWTHWHRCEVEA